MTTKPLASIILSTYNAPRLLALSLASFETQTERNFELHIADDGSTSETAELIRTFASHADFPVIHSWQEDRGFRKTRILNESIRKARADYFIFADGDCICHKDFIRAHLQYREPGRYLAGRRMDLGPQLTAMLTPEKVRAGAFNRPNLNLLLSSLRHDSEYFHRSIPVTNPFLRKILKMERIDDLKGCNFSIDREALFKINGFDEDYEGWGREDTDLELRLKFLGLSIKSLKGLALVYHLWHERRPHNIDNDRKLTKLGERACATCKNGIVKQA